MFSRQNVATVATFNTQNKSALGAVAMSRKLQKIGYFG